MKTLIVEDDFITRCVLQSSLSRYGVSHIAVNGDEAVEAFRSGIAEGFPYDLVCMDIQMPGMDGKEAVRQIRAQETSLGVVSSRGVKIIMITSLDSVTEVVEAFQQLCDAYLFKPIDLTRLLAELRAFHLIG